MTTSAAEQPSRPPLPPRFAKLSAMQFTLAFAAAALVIASIATAAPSPDRLAESGPRVVRLLERACPPRN